MVGIAASYETNHGIDCQSGTWLFRLTLSVIFFSSSRLILVLYSLRLSGYHVPTDMTCIILAFCQHNLRWISQYSTVIHISIPEDNVLRPLITSAKVYILTVYMCILWMSNEQFSITCTRNIHTYLYMHMYIHICDYWR
jgi:hypothetical protein